MMNKETFGAFIAQIRKEKGLTQQKLADRLHVTDKAVSKWERGLCYPDLTLMEPLAAALDLSVSELMSCQRQEQAAPEDVKQENAAVQSLLDISGSVFNAQKTKTRVRSGVIILLLLLALVLALFSGTRVREDRRDTIIMKQAEDGGFYVWVEQGTHLIRLQCRDEAMYDAITADDTAEYRIQFTWNRRSRQGTLERCEAMPEQLMQGSMMDQVGASLDFGSVLGIDCVWMEYQDIYPDPERSGGWLYTYRLWYCGDGSDYFAPGEETTLLTLKDCRAISAEDRDGDGTAELFVLTRYEEEPYLLYQLRDGSLTSCFVREIPPQTAEWFGRYP